MKELIEKYKKRHKYYVMTLDMIKNLGKEHTREYLRQITNTGYSHTDEWILDKMVNEDILLGECKVLKEVIADLEKLDEV